MEPDLKCCTNMIHNVLETAPGGRVVECSPGVQEVMASIPSWIISMILKMAPGVPLPSVQQGYTKEIWSVFQLSTVKRDRVRCYINMLAKKHSGVAVLYLLQVGTVTI